MEQMLRDHINASIETLHLPAYQEIPDVGLYLEQTAKYISDALAPIQDTPITGSMISNYVKKGLVANPVRKQYDRDQIAYLFFIAVAKTVLSLDALANFIRLQKQTYPLETAYDYFCRQLEGLLQFTFELTDTMDTGDTESTDEKRLLYSCIVAVTQKIYLEKCLNAIAEIGRASCRERV